MVADRDKVTRMLKTARGQLDGLLRMVDEDRYCLDISNQLMAAEAILRKVNRDVIQAHLESCVKSALISGDASGHGQDKIGEIMMLVDKLTE